MARRPRAPSGLVRASARQLPRNLFRYAALFAAPLAFGHIVVRFILGDPVIPFDATDSLKALVLSSEWLNSVPTFNFALWYLPLFAISSAVFILLQFVRWVPAQVALAVLLAVSAIPLQHWLPGRPPLSINVLPVALAFMICGRLLAERLEARPLTALWAVPLAAVSVFGSAAFPGNVANIGTIAYYPVAIAGILVVHTASRVLAGSQLITTIGRHSLLVYGLHGLIAYTYPRVSARLPGSTLTEGLLGYLVNAAYVAAGSLVAALAVAWLGGRLRRLLRRAH